jgi:hypothetical protein
VGESEREVEPPLHPTGVGADLAVGRGGEPDALEQLLGAAPALVARDPVQGHLEAQVLAPGQERVERRLLERRPDRRAHLRPLLHDVEAGDARAPRRRREQRRQHVHGGRLAGAVRAEEAVDLAGRDRQVDPVDRADPALELANQPFRLDPVVHALNLPAAAEPTARGSHCYE